MQAKVLLEKTGCPEPTLKDWLRNQVIVPLHAGKGPGTHAEYDDANLIMLALALRMKESAIVVAKYAGAFKELHLWLRSRSAIEWPRHLVVMSLDAANVLPIGKWDSTLGFGYVVDLGALCRSMQSAGSVADNRQLPLIGLEMVRR